MADEQKAPKIEITRVSVNLDPSVDVFNVVLENGDGVWHESWGTEGELRAFLAGVRAAYGMVGIHLVDPEIPRSATVEFSEEKPETD